MEEDQHVGPFEGVGPALALLRKRSKLQQAEIAERLGTSVSSISRYEADDGAPSSRRINDYLLVVGATAHDLAAALDQVSGRPSGTSADAQRLSDKAELGDITDLFQSMVDRALMRRLKEIQEDEDGAKSRSGRGYGPRSVPYPDGQ